MNPSLLCTVLVFHALDLLGESSIEVEFAESDMVRTIFGKMDTLNCLYTVQILPKTDQDSFEIFVFDKLDTGHRIFSGIKVFR